MQSPSFSGQYRLANQSLHDLAVPALAAFNDCLGGGKMPVTKRITNRPLGSQWQVEFDNIRAGYLLGYIDSQQGFSRARFSQDRYATGLQQVEVDTVPPTDTADDSWQAGLLIANVEDSGILEKIDFDRADWANQFNVHYKKISSTYSEL